MPLPLKKVLPWIKAENLSKILSFSLTERSIIWFSQKKNNSKCLFEQNRNGDKEKNNFAINLFMLFEFQATGRMFLSARGKESLVTNEKFIWNPFSAHLFFNFHFYCFVAVLNALAHECWVRGVLLFIFLLPFSYGEKIYASSKLSYCYKIAHQNVKKNMSEK